ncbi:thioredoxin family protein [Pedobacter frigoris]|uniref:Thioredoxin family protein n=1 Tax=Pedobacter frigoris TaxID=2571272 RepID=A0A4U1CPU9_9SPHI|nr:thioredoxin family protein [Pedobacter frigoris]TKC09523.1 thioredoxin family protein [Pedobacter frigoris]
MKLKIFLSGMASVFILNTAIAQTTPTPANEVLSAAVKKAKAEKKNVLLMFHASWCGWCHKMDASLKDPAIKPFFDRNYVIADIVVYEHDLAKKSLENPGAAELLKKYNNADQGLPTWLVFDQDQNLLADSQMRPEGAALTSKGENVGCPAAEKEVAYFISTLKKSSKMTAKELDEVAVVFRKNEIKRN